MNTNATWSEMSSLVYADKKKCPLLTKQLEYLKIKNEKGTYCNGPKVGVKL